MMKRTKIDAVVDHIKTQIENKSLSQGAKLLSVRQMANRMNYSISTVVEAYSRLVSLGIIDAKMGSGYYIAYQSNPIPIIQAITQYDRDVDPLWISRQSLDTPSDVIKAGSGWLPLAWMPEQVIRGALKTVSKSAINTLVDYSIAQGHLKLRQYIARKNLNYDLNISSSEILITDSATQSIDLIFRLLLKPGDIILIDDPCYFNFLALTKVHHLQAIEIPFTENGPNIERFENALAHQPKLYITNSAIHNPTGATLSLQTAFQVAKMAEKAQLTIVEDDIFAEFEFNPSPRYSALLGLQQVIQIGSFSKTLSASVRCGYIATDLNKIEQLIDLKIATHFSSGHLNAEIVYQALIDSRYKKHIEYLRQRLLKSMHETMQQLHDLGIETIIQPKAGIFLWCKLPHAMDAAELSKLCIKHNVILAPGHAFSQSPDAKQYVRFNVAQSNHPKVYQVIKEAMQVLADGQVKLN